jgi:hypothetical protein
MFDPPDLKRLLVEAQQIHDRLEARGFAHREICAILGAGFSFSLSRLSPSDYPVCLQAHLEGINLTTRPARRRHDA